MINKKPIPGPGFYEKTELKRKIYGYYDSTVEKVSDIECETFSRMSIPAPNKYESRGKSMSEILKLKAKAFMYQHENDYTFQKKIKKDNKPGPTSYKVVPAIEFSA